MEALSTQGTWSRWLTSGLAHLIPWTPLVVYLTLRLTGDVVGPQVGPGTHGNLYPWAVIFLTTVVACLAFDVYDVLRS